MRVLRVGRMRAAAAGGALRQSASGVSSSAAADCVAMANFAYYDISWFDPVGRQFFMELHYRFGGR